MSAADDAESDFYAALGDGNPEAVAIWAKMHRAQRVATLRLGGFDAVEAGTDVRQEGKIIGRAISNSRPDPERPGYFLVEVALAPSFTTLIPPDGVYSIEIDVRPAPFKDIIGDLEREAERLDEATLGSMGWERATWHPTRKADQAWLVAAKFGISVVKLPDGKGWMAGVFDETDCFMPDLGVVDGRMDHCATAVEMPLAVCRAAKKILDSKK